MLYDEGSRGVPDRIKRIVGIGHGRQGMDGAHHGLGPSAWIGKEAKIDRLRAGFGLSYAGSSIGLMAMLVALIGLGLVIVIVPSLAPRITPPTR